MEYNVWKLQDAKAQFSKVVRDALADGPQYITRHGEEAVVVLSKDTFEKLSKNLSNSNSAQMNLTDFLQSIAITAEADEMPGQAFDRLNGELRDADL